MRRTAAPVALAILAFAALGLPDAALGVAWPGLRDAFGLPQAGMGLILAATSLGFLAASNTAATLMERFGPGRVVAAAIVLLATALAVQATAAEVVRLLAAAVVLGLGGGAIDAGLNGYAATRFSRRDMNWLHAGYGLGTAAAPFAMTAALAAGIGWRGGYAALAVVLALAALLFWRRRHAWPTAPPARHERGLRADALGPRAAAHLVAFFLYSGIEVTAGQWSFAVLSEARGLAAEAAGIWTALYWTGLFGGRLAIGFVADRLGGDRLVALGTAGLLAGTVLFWALPDASGGAALVVVGVAAAPVFPMLMSRTAERFAPATARRLFGLQVSAAMLGGVALPAAAGALADVAGLATVPCFLVAATATLALVTVFILRRGPARGT